MNADILTAWTWQDYADLGFDTLPLPPGKKKANIKNWQNATPEAMWRDAPPEANIGIRCGGDLHFCALDADNKKDAQTSGNVTRFLAGLGYLPGDYPLIATPTLLPDGTTGFHCYGTLTGTLPGYSRAWATDFGAGEFRYGCGAYVGAPPSFVTEAGNSYRLLSGDYRQLPKLDVKDILPLLKNKSTGPQNTPRPPSLSRRHISRLAWKLFNGHGIERYASRSEAEQALVCSLVKTGYDFDSIFRLFLSHPCAGKFAELYAAKPENAMRYLRVTFDAAQRFTARESPGQALARRAILFANSAEFPVTGRTRENTRAVFVAHATIAERAGRETYAADCRTLGDVAGVAQSTAATATKRLCAAELVEAVNPFDAGKPSAAPTYRLNTKLIHSFTDGGIECMSLAPLAAVASHDVFRTRGGLGKVGLRLWQALTEHGAQTVDELTDRTGTPRRTVKRSLSLMARIVDTVTGEVAAVVNFDGEKWRALPAVDFDAVARILGTAGRGQRQRERHATERQDRRRDLKPGRAIEHRAEVRKVVEV
jgi:hypothetical protein